jgi:4'-phosphopantetheinyl transferase
VQFLSCWTRKEAVAKAIGKGLGLELRGFDVAVPASGRPESVTVTGFGTFTLIPFAPLKGYIGAVAVAGAGWHMSLQSVPRRATAGPQLSRRS